MNDPAQHIAAEPVGAERRRPGRARLDEVEVLLVGRTRGQPAATVPAGFTASGLSVGLQIVGRRFDDLTVLQASAAFETARPWAARRPPNLP